MIREILFKAILIVGLILLTILQTLSIPGQFRYLAQTEPNNAYLRWPLTIFGMIAVLMLQLILVSLWKLIREIHTDRPFNPRSLKFLTYIFRSLITLVAIFSGGTLWVLSRADDPGMPFVLILITGFTTLISFIVYEIKQLFARNVAKPDSPAFD